MRNEGRFVWYELMTTDVEAAKEFYADVVGWNGKEWPGPNPYYLWSVGETQAAGMMEMPEELRQMGVPPHWMAYVAVGDVDAKAAQARQLGGQVRVEPTDIPEVGRFAVIADPQGATISMLTPQAEGTPPDRRKSGFIGWHELYANDHASDWAFYSALFPWKHTQSMDMGDGMGDYFIFAHADDPDEQALGGMSDMAKQMKMPPNWLYYVNVDDLADAMVRVRDGGGKVLNGPMDVPGGRIAQCSDPQGAMFAMYEQES